MLAVGIAAALTRRRRRRQLELPRGARPPTPPPDLDDLRAEIVMSADLDQATRLHRALRDVALALTERRSETRPRVVQVTGQRIEVLLSQPVLPAPPPWREEAAGAAWVLKVDPADADDDGPAPTPALVSIGRPDDETELYLDLEAEGVVALTGDPSLVADVARSWILELGTSPMAGGASIVVVGDGLRPPAGTSDRVVAVSTWEEVADDAVAWVEQSAALMAGNSWTTPLVGRMRSRQSDDLAPLIIFVEQVDEARFETLRAAILGGQVSVVLVVLAGDKVEGASRVELSGTMLTIPSLGLTCEAQAVPAATIERVDDLLEDASRLPEQLSLIPRPPPTPPVTVGATTDEYQDPPFEILVRLLGDISVVGASRSLKPKQVAVLAYVALHAPAASERVEDAVWVAPTASRRKRLANTVSETRRILGVANVPLATDGRYRVGPGLITDLDLFERRILHAQGQGDVAAVATLRGALELVDGPVFTYRNAERLSYVWVDVENWISDWELRVADTAEDLAERCLNFGDTDGAVWAARRGLSTCPTHASLTRLLMQAHVAAGDDVAAKRVFESHQSVLEKLELDGT
ncbi:MAG: AfsR/SARP family transcriptional regulator, partial [Acidimicrobiales bacterium]